MNKDIEEIRALFPVVEHWTYLYNGSVHPQPTPVVEAMTEFVRDWSQGGEAAYPAGMDAFMELREGLARLIGGKGSNIVITDSTTAALNLAAQLVAPRPDQNVVLEDLAFMTNTYPWLVSGMAVPDVRFVPEVGGMVRDTDLRAAVDAKTALLSLSAVSVSSGFRHDLQAISELAAATGVRTLIDGAQAVGVVDIDLAKTPLDFVAGTAAKWLMGPAGVGYLHIDDRHLDATPPTTGWLAASNVGDWDLHHAELHQDAMRFQGGLPNFTGVVGTLAAIRFREALGTEFVMGRIKHLADYLIGELGELGADIWTPLPDHQRAGIVFFRSERAQEINERLRAERIYCGTFMGGIRCDPSFYNTEADIDRLLAVVAEYV